ncbi:hypothetical protein ASC66_01670 [Leifsonia sp. Root4]|uniref:DUF6636 domain-containing protein n=1 Tax=Leifsonia sp. Root4 TaxID=1736525 RepID=UPI0006F633AE|nr:DUF6636 domain-containing protein [Leifsonia sp. Root4]KQW07717.1 hypothetical protein ASC66_01670 [Leifsonia sp. Root4]
MTRPRHILSAAALLIVGLTASGCAGASGSPIQPTATGPTATSTAPGTATPDAAASPVPTAEPIAVEPADYAPLDFGTGVVFTSPSRNLRCGITTQSAEADSALWGCAIGEKEWEFPRSDPSDFCFDAQVPCGNGIEAVGSEQPHPRMRGDVAFESEYSESSLPLPVGTSIRYGNVLCTSTEAGIACSNALSGHGFALSETNNDIW